MPVVPDRDFDEALAARETRRGGSDPADSGRGMSTIFEPPRQPSEEEAEQLRADDERAMAEGGVTGAVAGALSAGDFLAEKLDSAMMALVGGLAGTSNQPANDTEDGEPPPTRPPVVAEPKPVVNRQERAWPEREPLTFGQILKRTFWGVLGLAVLVALYVGSTFYQVWSLSSVDDTVEGTGPYDAIVVLGAAQYNGEPSPVFAGRLDRALELYEDGFADFIVTTGAKQDGDTYTEGYVGYEYLRDRGVPDEAVLVTVNGTNTWEQLSETAAVLEDRKPRVLGLDEDDPASNEENSVLMVSDPYHNYRMAKIAAEVGLDPYVAPTDVDPVMGEYVRETAAVSAGQIIGFRRLRNLTDN